jgi:serpin B
VSLPYGDGSTSLYLFLPAAGADLDAFPARLAAKWEEWMGGFHEMPGDLRLPRFKFAYDVTLNEALGALGMAGAFDPRTADFGAMTNENAYLSAVKHKSFIEVNEEGTEAAAVTIIGVGATSVPQRFSFSADRPFYFAIRHNPTGTILFMGTMVDPR